MVTPSGRWHFPVDPDLAPNYDAPSIPVPTAASEYVHNPTLNIGELFPSLSLEQLGRAAKSGLYLQVQPDVSLDFADWRPFLPHIRGLYLAGSDRLRHNMSLLEECVSLRSLVAETLRTDIDVSGLPSLEQASGLLRVEVTPNVW